MNFNGELTKVTKLQQFDIKFKHSVSTVLPSLWRSILAYQNSVSIVFTVVLWVIFAWFLGQVVWMPFHRADVSIWKPTTSSHSSVHEVFDSRFVKQQNLFGEFHRDATSDQVAALANAPKTKLNLKLVGVVASDNKKDDLAIIALQGEQSTYGLDESIEGTRASLKAVLNDRVIISNAGRDETLMLDNEDSQFFKSREPITGKNKPSSSARVQPNSTSKSDAKLAEIKREISRNPQNLFQYVRLSQIKRNNRVIGYRLSPGRSPELFQSVGLKRGDIAVRVNDIDLTDKNAMAKISTALSDLSNMKIMVERNGQSHEIYIQF